MSELEWKDFVDNNIVSYFVLYDIAIKIVKCIQLTEREQSVYSNKSKLIEIIISTLDKDECRKVSDI